MAEFPKLQAYGPTVKKVFELLDENTLKLLPSAPENTKNYVTLDAKFWADNSERIERRYQTWLSQ
jgi:putative spermidine/putrescine transport system substrate-binding protein